MKGNFQPDKYYELVDSKVTKNSITQTWKPLNAGNLTDVDKVILISNDTKLYPLFMPHEAKTSYFFDTWSQYVAPLSGFEIDTSIFDIDDLPNKKCDCVNLSKKAHVDALRILKTWYPNVKPQFGIMLLNTNEDDLYTLLDTLSIKGYSFNIVHLYHLNESTTKKQIAKILGFLKENKIKGIKIFLDNANLLSQDQFQEFIDLLFAPAAPIFVISQEEVRFDNDWYKLDDIFGTDAKGKKVIDCFQNVKKIVFKVKETKKWPLTTQAIIDLIERSKSHLAVLNLSRTSFSDDSQTDKLLNLIPSLTHLQKFSWHHTNFRYDDFALKLFTLRPLINYSAKLARNLASLKNLKIINIDLPIQDGVMVGYRLDTNSITALSNARNLEMICYHYIPISYSLWTGFRTEAYIQNTLKNSAKEIKII